MENITFPGLIAFWHKVTPRAKTLTYFCKGTKTRQKENNSQDRTKHQGTQRIVPHPLIGFVSLAFIICHTTVSLAGPHTYENTYLLTYKLLPPPSSNMLINKQT